MAIWRAGRLISLDTEADFHENQRQDRDSSGREGPMTDMIHPHDRFLKALLSNPDTAGTLLRERLPKAVVEVLSPDPPELMDGSFVDEELRAHLTDRLYRVKTITGRAALLYVLIEHKSAPDARIGWQLLKYLIEALKQWERENPEWKHLPAIIPFVFYHGSAIWRIPDEFLALVDAETGWRPYLLNFRFTVLDLGRIDDRQLSRQPSLRAWLLAAKYATRDGQQIEVKELLVEALVGIPDEDFRFLMRYVVETYRSYDEPMVREIIRRVRPEEEEKMMSMFAQDMIAKGERRGRQIGRQEGRQEEAASMLLKQMRRKFGQIPDWVAAKVNSADLERIEAWSDNFVFANSVDEVFIS
ncbi:MAG: Rpn family recombination-promoting nuclease/putative transposase [Magnetococcales bacterium]|nr:Rpn family recombination-promoting nuclease/putative transposase [Magnetococcales bacterium]